MLDTPPSGNCSVDPAFRTMFGGVTLRSKRRARMNRLTEPRPTTPDAVTLKSMGHGGRVFLAIAASVAVAWFVLALLLSVWGNLLGQGIGKSLQVAFDPKGKGVAITSCGPDNQGRTQIQGIARNALAVSADYSIVALVRDQNGHQVAEGHAAPWRVSPGRRVVWSAQTEARFVPGVTCELSTVTRLRDSQP